MKVLTEDEIVQKYDSYLPADIKSFTDLLEFIGISREQLSTKECVPEETVAAPGFREKIKKYSPINPRTPAAPTESALKILLLDVSQFFSSSPKMLYDVVEPPLGLMYLLTYLNRELGAKIKGKIAKSRIDFDNFNQLKQMLEEFKPDLIGIRSLTFHKNFFHQTTAMIRQWGIETPIVAGGPYASSDYKSILQDPNIDLVVRGEGEITFALLVNKILENNGKMPDIEVLKKIEGLAFIPPQTHHLRAREVILLDRLNEKLSGENAGNPGHINHSSHPAYVIFTSGSTGKPKGTLTTHTNVVRVVKNTNYIDITPDDRVLQLSNYAFDGSIFDIYGAFLNGGALVMLTSHQVGQLNQLTDVISDKSITVFFVTTALFNLLVDHKIQCFRHIRKVLFGGERVSVEHARKLLDYMGTGKILHVYGPTETTVYATYYPIDQIARDAETIPIGPPISNTSVYILDKYLKPVPMMVPGEVYIGGDGLALGYLNDQELTFMRFIDNPFDKGEKIYLSGDLGRWLPGGNIEFIGRIDQQVKIRGFRIEFGEIEKHLVRLDYINTAVVLAGTSRDGDRYLCAYVTVDEQKVGQLDTDELRRVLSVDLPDYMIPNYFIQLEKIPLTLNGKVDTRALPEPGAVPGGTVYTPPTTPMENRLVEIWSEVLGIKKELIGIEADFFELGGHSLKATLLISKIHQAFNVNIPLAEFFGNPTIRALAGPIMKGLPESRFLSIRVVEEKEYYPLSSPQKRLYVIQRMEPEAVTYNIPHSNIIEGELDKEMLTAVFRKLIQRHESLRTSFAMVNNEPVQKIHQEAEFEIEYYDLQVTGASDRCKRENEGTRGLAPLPTEPAPPTPQPATTLISSFIHPFDLSQAPLLRVRLIKEEKKYILMVDMHHIISDGTSMDILIKEFSALYSGKELSPIKLQHKDYSQWQNSENQGQAIKQQEKYWLKQFEDEIPVLDLPGDYPRPPVQSFEGSIIRFELTSRQTAALNSLAREQGVTLYMLLLAITNIFLAKISNREDIVIGTPIAARRHMDLEKIIGMFVNTLALRHAVPTDQAFKTFLKNVKEKTLKAFENQDYPFEDLVEKAGAERDMSRNPLFDVMFILQNMFDTRKTTPAKEKADMKIKASPDEHQISKFDLTLSSSERGEKLYFSMQYCTRLFKEATILRFIDYFKQLVISVIAEPGKKIGEMEIIPREERERLLSEFNRPPVSYPENQTIHGLFARQVQRTPDHIATVGPCPEWLNESDSRRLSLQVSYRQLEEKSTHLALRLKEKGVEPESIVGIMVERSMDMLTGLLGIMKAGGAYLPIDPQYPAHRSKYMLEDSQVHLLLYQENLKDRITFDAEDVDYLALAESNDSPPQQAKPGKIHTKGDLAYIIFTSGSTGKPKGVIVQHDSIVNTLAWRKTYYEFGPGDAVLQVPSFSFDSSVEDIFTPLISGSKLVLIPPASMFDLPYLKEVTARNRINHFLVVPGFYKTFLAEIPGVLTGFKSVTVAGDNFTRELVEQHFDKLPGVKLYNEYGPTENSVCAAVYQFHPDRTRVLIGVPINNVKCYILNKERGLSAVNTPGELYLSGTGLARGYLNRPALTADRFVENPFRPGEKMYRTGDMARWLPDGNIEFFGRIDYQVKIRGFRIELGEIESQLRRIPGIKEAVVIAREESPGERKLAAFIAAENTIDASVTRAYLLNVLPDYMVPSYFVQVEAIPLTPHGKVDRKSLPHPEEISMRDRTGYTPPASAPEKKLAEIWEKVLGKKRIGIYENYFSLGGDSIKSIQVISRMHSAGYKLEMKDLFKYPVISELAPHVEKLKHIPEQSAVTGAIPLTPHQREFFNQSPDHVSHFNRAVLFYNRQGFDKEVIKTVFTRIQRHHDALRITYERNSDSGEIIQVNHGAPYPLSLQEYDLKNRDNSSAELQTKIKGIQAGIDLEKGPLMKLGLFHLDDGDRLLIVLHPLVSDDLSWSILLEDIERLYRQHIKGEKPDLPAKTDSFKLWSEQLAIYADSKALLKEKTYWAQLETNKIPALKKDFAGEENDVKDTRGLSFTLEKEETSLLLTKVNEPFKTGIKDILLTALALGIKKTFGRNRLLIALPGQGREQIPGDLDTGGTVGCFTGLYPLVLDVSYENDIGRQVKEIKETLRNIPNNGMGYGILKYLTKEENKKDLEFQLNPQISFNYPEEFDGEEKQISFFEIAKEPTANTRPLNDGRGYELDVSGKTAGNRLTMTISYNQNYFKPETAAKLAGFFKSQLQQVIAFCSSKEDVEYTPSDFTYKGLSMDVIDRLIETYPDMEDIYSLSPMQEGMLFHSLYDDSSHSYFEQLSYHMQGQLDINLVEKSFNELFKRHDILRTAFVYKDIQRPVQVVLKDRNIDFYYEDIAKTREPKEQENLINQYKIKDRERLFDLSKDALMRIAIFRVDRAQYEFVWTSHHILMDGWCFAVLINEFFEIYAGYVENRPYRLPSVKPYRTYIQWLERQDREESANYWRNYLDSFEEQTGISKLNTKRKTGDGYRASRLTFALDRPKTDMLKKLAAKHHVTLNILTETLWGILVGKYNRKNDVVFGIVASGRPPDLDGVETMVGLFINTVPVRIRFHGDMKFITILKKVQEQAIASELHHNYPLTDIQARTPLKQDLIDHVIAFDNNPLAEQIEGREADRNKRNKRGMKFSRVEIFEQSNYDFNVGVSETSQLNILFQYNEIMYDRDFVERIAHHYISLFDRVLENEESEIRHLVLLSGEEKTRVLYEFNRTENRFPKDKTLHQLFEEQVARKPDNIALIGPGRIQTGNVMHQAVTYRELNRKSNRLAHLLGKKGAAADVLVGLIMERSIEMMVGILGILKAGGAYLPVDPETPQNRMAAMLDDADVSMLLTHSTIAEKISLTDLQGLESIKIEPVKTPVRPQILDIDSLPFPDRSMVDIEKYNQYLGEAMVKNSISLLGSRGCPYNCAYCHRIWPKNHVFRSAENIFAEVKQYYDMGIRRFSLLDDIFNLNKKNSSKFFNLLIKNNMDVQLFFSNGVRADILTKEYIDLMVEAGLVEMAFALETASPRLQKLVGKHLNLEKLRENIEYVLKTHPQIVLDLFTMVGFPSETEKEAMKTINFVKSFKWLHFPYVSTVRVYPNTEMMKLALESGVSMDAIYRSQAIPFHELPDTLPLSKSFVSNYQADFVNNIFLCKERLLYVLPHQMKVFTENEIIKKYNSYFPHHIGDFDELLKFLGITREELGAECSLDESVFSVPHLNEKLKKYSTVKKPAKNALRILLMDLTQNFSTKSEQLQDLLEPPLGFLYLQTYLNQQLGDKVHGKIIKSYIDFDNYADLKAILDDFKPDLIGVRTLTFYKNLFHETISMIRQWGITVPIIAGGPYATSVHDIVLQDRNIDIIVRGEGEITFRELIKEFINNPGKLPDEEVLKKINGLAFIPRQTSPNKKAGREIVMMDVVEERLSALSPDNPAKINNSPDLAYSIFTSGSTGKPKGTLTSHQGVLRVVKSSNYLQINEHDRVLQLSNYAFDGSVFDIYGALLNGAPLVLAGKEEIRHINLLSGLIKNESITVFFVTTALFNTLVDMDITGLKDIRNILFGGERVSVEHTKKALDYLGKGKVIHMYGPTETTVYATAYQVNSINEEFATIPIGGPISNTSIYILDEDLQPQPPGVRGELYIGGEGVARGYLNRPELTVEKFQPVTIDNKHLRLYKSGDLARWLPDGSIEFIDRVDQQVKIRGFRIELEGIESQLIKYGPVKEAVVINRKDKGGNNYLSAYIVRNPAGSSSHPDDSSPSTIAAELRDYLSKKLPDFMIPTYFVMLEKIPLNANGKVDRKALPEPEIDGGDDFIAPRNEVEMGIVHILSEVLGIEYNKISVRANLFDLGINSITSLKIAHRLSSEFNTDFHMSTLFSKPSVEMIVEDMKQNNKPIASKRIVLLNSGNADRDLFIQGGEGEIYGFKELARLLESRFNVYGIQARGIMDSGKLPETRKELFDEYLSEIKLIQPQGPYLLAGHCWGAIISYELTRILEDRKEKVEKMIILDESRLMPEKFLDQIKPFRLYHAKKKIRRTWKRFNEVITGKKKKANTPEIDEKEVNKLPEDLKARRKQVQDNFRRLFGDIRHYTRIINSPLLIILARESVALFAADESGRMDPRVLAKQSTGPAEVCETTGGHDSMFFQPHVQSLAKIMLEKI
jgi:amino acid adenylation domain-containing protein/non-ribosomal peptide synthase protein (TIGR01720 family)